MSEIITLTRGMQAGLETTLGTPVAASKQFPNSQIEFVEALDTAQHTPVGQNFATKQTADKDYTDGTIAGLPSYAELPYYLEMIYGDGTTTTPVGATNARQRVYTHPLAGRLARKSLTVQRGDAVLAQQVPGVVAQQLDLTLADKCALGGKAVGWNLNGAATLTASPTLLPNNPIIRKHVNVYLDPTSGAIGTTKLNRFFEAQVSLQNLAAPIFPLNRALVGYAAMVDTLPKPTIRIKVMADSVAYTTLLSAARSGALQYLRLDCQGDLIESTTIYDQLTIDAAVVVAMPQAASDMAGAWVKEFELQVAGDAAWNGGQALSWTVVSLVSTL